MLIIAEKLRLTTAFTSALPVICNAISKTGLNHRK